VFLYGPGEKVGCAKFETEACIACQCPSQATKQDYAVVVQIFDHRRARSDALPDAPGDGCI
jgi:hypothetical protein